jgi:RimJ/RimL family protein N-acetyltransferase
MSDDALTMERGGFFIGSDFPNINARFVGERTGEDFSTCPYAAFGLFRIADDRRAIQVGAVVFNLFTPPDISVSVAVDPAGRPGVRRLIAACRRYAFGQLGCARVSASIRAENAASLTNAIRLGFEIEGVKRRAAPDGGDVVMLGYLRKED